MAGPAAASPPLPAPMAPSELAGGLMSDDPTNNNVLERKLSETAASPDDFIALAKGGGGGSGGEGGNIAPPSVVTTAPPSVVVTNAAGNTSKRNRSGPKKFSFYTPTASSQNSDLNRITESGGSSGGGGGKNQSYNKQNSGKQQTTTAQRGVDPPEVEKPTAMAMQMAAMSAEESAWKARSRLIQLQHRESRAQQQQQQHRRSRSANIDEEDDDDDYPMVNIDPIESDDELQLGPYEDGVVAALPKNSKNSGMKQQQQRHQPMYRSPIQGRNNDQSYMKQHPSSAPVRPSHRVPPKQLMQYLHAGRGSFGGGGGGGGRQQPQAGGMATPPFGRQQQMPGGMQGGPLPLYNNNVGGGPNNNMQQQQQQMRRTTRKQRNQGQQHSQSLVSQQQQRNQQQHQNEPRRKSSYESSSDHLHQVYHDGINILEQAASEAHEREEVETLNDGINYLRNLETALDSTQQQYNGGNNTYSPRKAPPPPPAQRPHRPPPQKNKGDATSNNDDRMRSSSLEAVRIAEQGQRGGRVHRPPPPRAQPMMQSSSVPSTPTTQARKRPVMSASAAMDIVMNATRPPLDVSDKSSGGGSEQRPQLGDILDSSDKSDKKMNSFLNALIRNVDEAIAVVEEDEEKGSEGSGGGGRRRRSSFDGSDDDHDDSSSRSTSDVDEDSVDEHDFVEKNDDFERNNSLSAHAEAKNLSFGSRYAEDKHGTVGLPSPIQLDDSSRRNSLMAYPKAQREGQQSMMDPPEAGSSADDDRVEHSDSNNEGISPSVVPCRTMNERLYAVEAVIPTPTRYDDGGGGEYADEVDSFDGAMPHLASHDEGSPQLSSHALGPRSKRPGGITGVVLDGSSPPDKNGDTNSSSSEIDSSQSGSSGSSDDDPHDVHLNRTESPLDDIIALSHRRAKSWSGEELASEEEGVDRESASLLMKLCSHLLPAGLTDAFPEHKLHHRNNDNNLRLTSSLTSLLLQSKNDSLTWDDNDPDEPGYVVHRLTNAELICVENAFEKMVNSLERSSVTSVRNGQQSSSNDKNFERDLEEAEMILDQEERRYQKESKTMITDADHLTNSARSDTKKEPITQITHQEEENDVAVRESVPNFPGIYPPGKGRQGEMECFYLPIITKSQKTGFEATKDLVLKPGSVFANNYLVQSELGSAAFSTAYRCLDLSSEEDEDGYQDEVCLKVIKNTKDYFDQSLDEIKILQLLKDTGRVQENNIVEMTSFFYHREHLVIVTELLRQNLYEFGKSILESQGPLYFTRARLSHITRQCLIALKFVHELGLMHCDIKPENILLSSYSRALVKVIDFGSSSFVTDRQSSYIQSRSYRAPEVILGLPYGGKIDMWSLGCVVAEMYTNEVTFQNDSELSMLSRIEAICGTFPRHMIARGRNSHRIFTESGLIYEKVSSRDDVEKGRDNSDDDDDEKLEKTVFNVFQPKMTTVAARLGFEEDFMDQPKLSEDDEKRALFVDFVSKLLTIDPDGRPSATEALNHPWITSSMDLTEDDIRYGQ